MTAESATAEILQSAWTEYQEWASRGCLCKQETFSLSRTRLLESTARRSLRICIVCSESACLWTGLGFDSVPKIDTVYETLQDCVLYSWSVVMSPFLTVQIRQVESSKANQKNYIRCRFPVLNCVFSWIVYSTTRFWSLCVWSICETLS